MAHMCDPRALCRLLRVVTARNMPVDSGFIAVSMLDRMLYNHRAWKGQMVQLMGLACLCIAM